MDAVIIAVTKMLDEADAGRTKAGMKPFSENDRKLATIYFVEGAKWQKSSGKKTKGKPTDEDESE
jgi:hypothetical protein